MKSKPGTGLSLKLLEGKFALCQLPPDDFIPGWAWAGELACVAATPQELSVLCAEKAAPSEVASQKGWRVLEVEGPLDPNTVGVIARISSALAEAAIPLCVISTYGTDYFLVKDEDLRRALEVLEGEGNKIRSSGLSMRRQ